MMIQISHNIYAVIVPKGAKPENYAINVQVAQFNRNHFFKYSILGTVTSESIDFDVSGIVKSSEPPFQPPYRPYGMSEEEYEFEISIANKAMQEWVSNNETSFRSLLKSKAVHIEDQKAVIIQKR